MPGSMRCDTPLVYDGPVFLCNIYKVSKRMMHCDLKSVPILKAV